MTSLMALPLDSLILRGVSPRPAFRPSRGRAWRRVCLRRRARKQKKGLALTPRNNRLSSGRAMAVTIKDFQKVSNNTWRFYNGQSLNQIFYGLEMILSDFSVFRGKSQKRLREQLKGVRYKVPKLMKFNVIFNFSYLIGGHLQTMLTRFKHFLNTYCYLHLHFLPYKYYFNNSSTESCYIIDFILDLFTQAKTRSCTKLTLQRAILYKGYGLRPIKLQSTTRQLVITLKIWISGCTFKMN